MTTNIKQPYQYLNNPTITMSYISQEIFTYFFSRIALWLPFSAVVAIVCLIPFSQHLILGRL